MTSSEPIGKTPQPHSSSQSSSPSDSPSAAQSSPPPSAQASAPSSSEKNEAAPAKDSKITEFGADEKEHKQAPVGLAAMLAVLGVVFGDIGTSPLYALKSTLLLASPNTPANLSDLLGIESLIFWSLILIVTIKYVVLIMRADHNGEGGILALTSLAQRVATSTRTKILLGFIGVIGTCLFFGDGMITPAISVLSAIEGLEVSIPSASHLVIPIALIVLVGLFSVQYYGTGVVGKVFGPVMLIWFGTLGILGILEITKHPYILLAILPHHAILFLYHHGWVGFRVLGSVVLAVTGAEALYADMGHFGRTPIRYAWLFYVLPALVLNYFGQGALLLSHPSAISNPFFLLCPDALRIPLFVLSTLATVIASQAGISGGFSLVRQVVQLGYFPRMRIHHTNANEEGQIYVPEFNRFLMIGALLLVITFQSSNALASAYGIAVTGTFVCTCCLAIVVFRRIYKWPAWIVGLVFGFFFIIDFTFFAANALKIPQGGWVPLVLGVTLTLMMSTWKKGRSLIRARQKQDSFPVGSFLARLPQSRTIHVPGTAVYMTATPEYVPSSLLHNLKHNKVLHEQIFLVTVENLDQPEVTRGHRIALQELAPNIFRVMVRYGFMEIPNLPRALENLKNNGVDFDGLQASYFLSHEMVVRSSVPKIALWRMWLFLFMSRNATPARVFFRIPADRVVEFGVKIAI
ncbi:potassium transporter Kup [Entomobacter blattae]|uniref:Probable potassium transport system protein Kup n=1 Tax=Entomobacter blattae TaxID=2762277 RepID=A0A7H1NQQ5_9PROT|nr:potassium transporter Kup [Entomobacter blattae]QNT78115.1 Low affinity potassium transport system protein kup [Entomobacter blattae]